MLNISVRAKVRCPFHRFNPSLQDPGSRRASCELCANLVEIYTASERLGRLLRAQQESMAQAKARIATSATQPKRESPAKAAA